MYDVWCLNIWGHNIQDCSSHKTLKSEKGKLFLCKFSITFSWTLKPRNIKSCMILQSTKSYLNGLVEFAYCQIKHFQRSNYSIFMPYSRYILTTQIHKSRSDRYLNTLSYYLVSSYYIRYIVNHNNVQTNMVKPFKKWKITNNCNAQQQMY